MSGCDRCPCEADELEGRLWAIIDRHGANPVPSSIEEAVSRLVTRAEQNDAAPALYEALQRAYDTFGDDGSSVWQEVRAALSLARGEG